MDLYQPALIRTHCDCVSCFLGRRCRAGDAGASQAAHDEDRKPRKVVTTGSYQRRLVLPACRRSNAATPSSPVASARSCHPMIRVCWGIS